MVSLCFFIMFVKTINFIIMNRINYYLISGFLSGLFLLSSCDKEENNVTQEELDQAIYQAHLESKKETTLEIDSAIAKTKDETNVFQYTLTFDKNSTLEFPQIYLNDEYDFSSEYIYITFAKNSSGSYEQLPYKYDEENTFTTNFDNTIAIYRNSSKFFGNYDLISQQFLTLSIPFDKITKHEKSRMSKSLNQLTYEEVIALINE